MSKISNNHMQLTLVTAGPNYLDIDAYACCVAMAELLQLKGENAIAYSNAPYNYSICPSLIREGDMQKDLPSGYETDQVNYIIVDVSDPDFLQTSVPLEQVVAVYDHHVGFEDHWKERIGDNACIEFIGAAATLIYRQWKKAGLQKHMTRQTALLLIAAILDNTLNLTSSNTTTEDIEAYRELCEKANIDAQWCEQYFSQVQASVEADLKNALFNDIKTISDAAILPPKVAQLCVWNADSILARLPEIRLWFAEFSAGWLLNIIDISRHCSCFVCDDRAYQAKIQMIFPVEFELGVGRLPTSYLRKEIIKRTRANRQ